MKSNLHIFVLETRNAASECVTLRVMSVIQVVEEGNAVDKKKLYLPQNHTNIRDDCISDLSLQ